MFGLIERFTAYCMPYVPLACTYARAIFDKSFADIFAEFRIFYFSYLLSFAFDRKMPESKRNVCFLLESIHPFTYRIIWNNSPFWWS